MEWQEMSKRGVKRNGTPTQKTEHIPHKMHHPHHSESGSTSPTPATPLTSTSALCLPLPEPSPFNLLKPVVDLPLMDSRHFASVASSAFFFAKAASSALRSASFSSSIHSCQHAMVALHST